MKVVTPTYRRYAQAYQGDAALQKGVLTGCTTYNSTRSYTSNLNNIDGTQCRLTSIPNASHCAFLPRTNSIISSLVECEGGHR